jgi:GTP-binding protein HflX
MSHDISGNIKSLTPRELRSVKKLYERRIDKSELVGLDLAREIYRLATELRRRVGVLISREGRIEEVFLGTKDILYLPDLGRHRFGQGRLRRLRLVFSDLSSGEGEAKIPNDIYTDLEKLRLDSVVSVREIGNRVSTTYAYLTSFDAVTNSATKTFQLRDLGQYNNDFALFVDELEAELIAQAPKATLVTKNRAVVVGVYSSNTKNVDASLDELKELCRTAGVTIADVIVQRRNPDPKTLLGKGKLEEVVLRCLRLGAELIIFDGELKPSQWRAITNATELKVLDRSMVILDIFAQRATSSDGRLQVELAQLKYNLPRLVEKDTGLSRLSGGIGGRGPGETKLEISRRRLRDRISLLEEQINKLGEQRTLRRQKQQELEIPVVAILGYTNVGKSSLFNALTKSDVIAENKLFATLDPARRRVSLSQQLSDIESVQRLFVLSDTVGFIRDLPAELKNAFRATLEELSDAHLLIHVLDGSDKEIAQRKQAVDEVLGELGVCDTQTITVINKIDKISEGEQHALCRQFDALPLSAKNRIGFDALFSGILSALFPQS